MHASNINTAKKGLCAHVCQRPRPLKFRHAEVQSDCRASSSGWQWIAFPPAPLPSPVSVRRPYNGVKGAKRFPHSLADAINTAVAAVHSADGKIPNDFITISLVSLRSQSLQAYYWGEKKCCFNGEQIPGLERCHKPQARLPDL